MLVCLSVPLRAYRPQPFVLKVAPTLPAATKPSQLLLFLVSTSLSQQLSSLPPPTASPASLAGPSRPSPPRVVWPPPVLASSKSSQPPASTFTSPRFQLRFSPAPISGLRCGQLQRFRTPPSPSCLPMQLAQPSTAPPPRVSTTPRGLPTGVSCLELQPTRSFRLKQLILLRQCVLVLEL